MAMKLTSGLVIKAKEPVDDRLVLTKAQMLSMKKSGMPEVYFALCSEDGQMYSYDKSNEPSDETGYFKKMTSSSSGGGNTSLESDITSTVDVGGISSGMTLQSEMSFTDVIKILLNKNNGPRVTVPETTFFEKGTTIESLNVDINVNKTTKDIKNIEIQYLDQSENIDDISDNNTKTIALSNITEDVNMKVIVTTTDLLKYEFSFMVCEFVDPIYYSYIDDTNIESIESFNKLLTNDNNVSIKTTIDGKYLCIVIPNEKTINSISDGSFEYIRSFDKKNVVIGDKSYNVYISDDIITCDDFIYTIKF